MLQIDLSSIRPEMTTPTRMTRNRVKRKTKLEARMRTTKRRPTVKRRAKVMKKARYNGSKGSLTK